MLCAILCLSAQDSTQVFRFGYISYEQALRSMADYAVVQQSMADLRAQYDAEQKRVEQDFNLKYEEFLEGQRDFPETILRKRQTELKQLLEQNVAFRNKSRQQLSQAEAEAMAPLKEKLAAVLAQIAQERGYAFVLNSDKQAVTFVNPAMGEDITELVITSLQK